MMSVQLKSFTWLCFACLVAGCSPAPQKLLHVSGRVVVDDQPLTGGTIRFVPEGGRPVSSTILADGSFQLGSSSIGTTGGIDGVPPGRYRVAVSSSVIKGGADVEEETIEWLAPRHYADFRTSGLEVDLETTQEDLVIELTWEGVERVGTEAEGSAVDAGASVASPDEQSSGTDIAESNAPAVSDVDAQKAPQEVQ